MQGKTRRADDTDVGSRGIWLGVGAPILGLVLLIIVGAFAVLWDQAQRQDRNWIKQTQRLVESALGGRAHALSNTIVDFGLWNAAYQAVSVRWNQDWVSENIYSAAVDGLVIFHRDGAVRFHWFADLDSEAVRPVSVKAVAAAGDAAQLDALAAGADLDVTAPTGFALADGKLMLVSASPFMWDTVELRRAKGNPRPEDYIAAIDFVDDAALAEIGQSLGVNGLTFRGDMLSGREADDLVWSPVRDAAGNLLGGLTWRNERPGSQQFAKVAWPIAFGILFAGALAILVTRHLVRRQIRVMTQAQSVIETGRLKAQFIATMSHELRTPLNAIIGYSELMHEALDAETQRDKEARADAERIGDSARHLLRLINEILDHARIDAGFLPIVIDQVDVSHALTEVMDVIEPVAQAGGNSTRVSIAEDTPAVLADAARLTQCLLNLAGNAAKFTKNGSIEISARPLRKGKRDFVLFEVTDTGAGIDRAALERLFTPFSQVDASDTRAHAGAGLGLSITRRLARAMGGDVAATSELNKGSTFSLWIPAAAALRRAA